MKSHSYAKHWAAFVVVVIASFAVLGYFGLDIYRKAPPYPQQVVSTSGQVLFTGDSIMTGQAVWQSIGGQEIGSIWGHGAYIAPDWSGDWLHREALYLAQKWSLDQFDKPFAELTPLERAQIKSRLVETYRTNTYDAATGTLHVSDDRALAIQAMGRYYAAVFGNAQTFDADLQFLADAGMTPVELRDAYAIATNTIKDPDRQESMNGFFFWAAWACATERPEEAASYARSAMSQKGNAS